MKWLYPLRLEASFHETIWGGQRLERERWKRVPVSGAMIGEAWETEISTLVQNGPYAGKMLGAVVEELGEALLGEQAMAIFGRRFPLLAKFIDANARLSVQVHPDDRYAAEYEGGKLGKTEFWYILAAEPKASIVHGFNTPTSRTEVQRAIEQEKLETLLHEEVVSAGDSIFVPAGTVHAIGSGVLLYELQEYSDITYRMYDYGRRSASGEPRQLHIERSLDVTHYGVSPRVKTQPVRLAGSEGYAERCLVACRYFVTREVTLRQRNTAQGYFLSRTQASCVILTALDAEVEVRYGEEYTSAEQLARGQTMVLPAALGAYQIVGMGTYLHSYVPSAGDEAWRAWEAMNAQ